MTGNLGIAVVAGLVLTACGPAERPETPEPAAQPGAEAGIPAEADTAPDPHAEHATGQPEARDAHAGHDTPVPAAAAAGHAAHAPGAATTPGAVQDPHAGHAPPAARAAPQADPHAGHAPPVARAAPQADPHAGHAPPAAEMTQAMAKLLELVRGVVADSAVRAVIQGDPELRDLWHAPGVRRHIQPDVTVPPASGAGRSPPR
jgi:hypothetical protein